MQAWANLGDEHEEMCSKIVDGKRTEGSCQAFIEDKLLTISSYDYKDIVVLTKPATKVGDGDGDRHLRSWRRRLLTALKLTQTSVFRFALLLCHRLHLPPNRKEFEGFFVMG
ncbi:hypothetical protein M0R45_010860 [Rubus argutus]|uniref:Uncharacterized protein n=1 Tax=Rubus argutus TaxID=59490 RepID=A0AAW1Y9Y8_RUBAR